jgi:hypothetical protein|tara:strand:- start:31 stop:249 length:219 start_codon:yes stop_codon:yes gene_type:complete
MLTPQELKMELKTESYKKITNPDNGETEYEITKTYEETYTVIESIADLQQVKDSLQSQINEINTKISDLEKL